MSESLMLGSQLARRLSVSPSTITNWATKHRPPLAFRQDGKRRWFSLDDYHRFAAAHASLRGVAKQGAPEQGIETVSALSASLAAVHERLRDLLAQIDELQLDSAQTRKLAEEMTREFSAALDLLPRAIAANDAKWVDPSR